jgi:DNA polymerase I
MTGVLPEAFHAGETSARCGSGVANGAGWPHIRAMPAPAKSSTSKPKAAASKPDAKPAVKPTSKSANMSRPLKTGDHVFLVDGSGYIFRAYHALPPLTRKSDGLQINAVLGFCNMLWKLLMEMKADERPTHLAVVFDKSEKTFRTDFYPDYKAHRPDAPDDLIPQFPLIREAVRAFDIPCLEQAGFEADDLIATYARLANEARATTTIVSSDKDLMQLVNDRVVMYDTMKDRRIGRAEVIEKFGVPPEKVIEVQSLIGDSTDNVPGVPGIGVKTAAQLIIEYGDLETLLKRASEIKQDKRRQSLIDHAELARISKRLVTLDQRVKLDVPVEDLAVHDPDYKHLVAFLKAMEFNTLTRRVAEKSGIEAAEIEADPKLISSTATREFSAAPLAGNVGARGGPRGNTGDLFPPPPRSSPASGRGSSPSPAKGNDSATATELTPVTFATANLAAVRAIKIDRSKYETVRTLDRLNAWIARAHETGVVAVDTETTSLDPMQAHLCGFSLAVAPNEACYVPIGHKAEGSAGAGSLFDAGLAPDQIPEKIALTAIKPLLEDTAILKVGQNLKYDWQIFARRGIDLCPHDDTMLMSYVLDAGKGGHGMDDLAKKWLDHDTIHFQHVAGSGKSQVTFDCVAIDKASEYAAEDADVTLRLWQALKPRLAAEHVATVYETLERPLVPVLAAMERRGISIDRVRAETGRARRRDQQARGRTDQPRQSKAARRHSVRQDGNTGRHQDQDRPMGDRCAPARGFGRTGTRVAAEDFGLAAGFQIALDLHRCAAGLRQSRNPPRAHELRPRGDHHRAIVIVGAKSAKHPGAHRGRPQNPPRVHCRRRLQARVR